MAAPSESGAWSNAVEVSTEQIAQQSAIAKAIKVLRMTRIGVLAYTSVIQSSILSVQSFATGLDSISLHFHMCTHLLSIACA